VLWQDGPGGWPIVKKTDGLPEGGSGFIWTGPSFNLLRRGNASERGPPKPMSKRRTHSPEFKSKVAMEAISGPADAQEIAADPRVAPDPGEQ